MGKKKKSKDKIKRKDGGRKGIGIKR